MIFIMSASNIVYFCNTHVVLYTYFIIIIIIVVIIIIIIIIIMSLSLSLGHILAFGRTTFNKETELGKPVLCGCYSTRTQLAKFAHFVNYTLIFPNLFAKPEQKKPLCKVVIYTVI